MKSQTECP